MVFDNLSIPPKKTEPIAEMKYPKSKNPKPVYFLLLKLFDASNHGIFSRNFYWLYLSGGNYKPLESSYREKKVPLKIKSKAYVEGSTYELEMSIENTSKNPNSDNSILLNNNFVKKELDLTLDESGSGRRVESGFFNRVRGCFSKDDLREVTVNGGDEGVAFFLHFSVHDMKKDSSHVSKEGDDTRILPVHYSNNYFSLVPGEVMPIKISFEAPIGVSPRVVLDGWNQCGAHVVHSFE